MSYQEPVDVHEQQCKQQSVEEKVERDIGDGLQAGDVRGVQHFEGEPVQSEAEPVEETSTWLHEVPATQQEVDKKKDSKLEKTKEVRKKISELIFF